MFTTREQATFILLGALLLVVVSVPSLRPLLAGMGRQLCTPKLAAPILIYAAYLLALIWIAWRLGAWTFELLGATILWFLFTGFGFFMSSTDAASTPGFFRGRALEALRLGAFFEFFLALHTFAIPFEIILQVVLAFLVMLQAVAMRDTKTVKVGFAIGWILGGIGMALLVGTIIDLASHWQSLDPSALAHLWALPAWLALAVMPFIFTVALYSEYELAFHRLYLANGSRHASMSVCLAVLVGLRLHLTKIPLFAGQWPHRVVEAGTFRTALAEVERFSRLECDD